MSREARSRTMRAIRSRWTRQEVLFGSMVGGWVRGTAAEANADFCFHEPKVAVFLDGDFWHGRSVPASLPDSWRRKLARTSERDHMKREALEIAGWTVLSCWESDFLADPRGFVEEVLCAVLQPCLMDGEFCESQELACGKSLCSSPGTCLWKGSRLSSAFHPLDVLQIF